MTDKMFFSKYFQLAIIVTIVTVFLPYRREVADVISLGYPFNFLDIRIHNLLSSTQEIRSLLQDVSLNLLIFLVDVGIVYWIMLIFTKIKKKLKK